ncbi:cell envelope biogenesis protein OmpA [Croceivirga lutea]|uniref:OmpA family protein n=1 Tax=Croceivirga lutea TaxID=1775167 RepID=UPI00163B1F56|nr:OmpA family protein [Croceivirga lutea]GGG51921.1 cell envelope biogenesis protein OmpA [Croceivirga lutea]
MKTIQLKYTCITLALLTFSYSSAQKRKVKKARDDYQAYAYQEAIGKYEAMAKDGYTDKEIYSNLGNANYYNANYEEAAKWYKELLEVTEEVDSGYFYRYAQSLKSLGEYEASDKMMEQFAKTSSKENRVAKFQDNKDYLKAIEAQSGRYTIKLLEINSKVSDFAPSMYGEQLVFSSARDTGIAALKVHEWNNQSFLDLYTASKNGGERFGSVEELSKILNANTHESSTAFSKDGKTIYFTRNNSETGRRFARDGKGVSRLKIFRAELVNGAWKNIVELPFNSDNYSTAHPTLSGDEKKLFFASNRPGTFGESDIYEVDINEDGSYSEPKNLGPTINTEGRETFPFISEEGILYFSSDGHPGLGGLDVFATPLNTVNNQSVVNLGRPVNSDEDDFSFVQNSATHQGYFASNRPGGVGSDDIYSFVENEPLRFRCDKMLQGITKNKADGSVLANTQVKLFATNGEEVASTVSDANGQFSLAVNCLQTLTMVNGDKQNYESDAFEMNSDFSFDSNTVVLELMPLRIDAVREELVIEPIYFDFDESFIRLDAQLDIKKVITYLNKYPNTKLVIESHTDSRATTQYNQKLSEKRAKETKAYLVTKGIAENRMIAKGFGESKLVNDCSDGVACSKAAHQLNRRSEFKIIEE